MSCSGAFDFLAVSLSRHARRTNRKTNNNNNNDDDDDDDDDDDKLLKSYQNIKTSKSRLSECGG